MTTSLNLKLHEAKYPGSPYVFVHPKTGNPVRDFRVAWAAACAKVSLPAAIFHDFRRTGVRNLVRAGVPEVIAMAISGHKTRSIFDRYNIVNEEDIKSAVASVETYLKARTGTKRAQSPESQDKFSRTAGAKLL